MRRHFPTCNATPHSRAPAPHGKGLESLLPPLCLRPASSFRDVQALRGCRTRARELGILDEFWQLVREGDINAAMGRLALEEERRQRRQARRTTAFLACSLTFGLLWLSARIWSG